MIQTTFDDLMKAEGYAKHSGSWYRRGHEVILIVNLQKSQYDVSYYVNVDAWLLPLGEAQYPKGGHVSTRITQLIEDWNAFEHLLRLETPISDEVRARQLKAIFREQVAPVLATMSEIEPLAASGILKKSLVVAEAYWYFRGLNASGSTPDGA